MDEKFAGIMDRLKRFYNKTKHTLKDTGRKYLGKKKTSLSGTKEFKAIKGKKTADAIFNAGGQFEPRVKVWFGPDARAVRLPNAGAVIVLRSGHVLKPIRTGESYELKYVNKLKEKGAFQKLKNFFSSGQGKALTTQKKYVKVDPKSRAQIIADGGEVESTILISFPAGSALVDVDGQALITLPNGDILSTDNGIRKDSTVRWVGKTREEPPEEEGEEPPGSPPPRGQPPEEEEQPIPPT